MPDKLLTLAEVAELTRVPEETLRYWRYVKNPRAPRSARFGKRVVYREADVVAWIDAQFADDAGADPQPAA